MPSPTIRESISSASNVAPTTGAGTAVGDLVVVFMFTLGKGAPTHTLQSGYTEIFSRVGTNARLSVAYKVATSAGAVTYTPYTLTGGDTLAAVVLFTGSYTLSGLVSNSVAVGTSAAPDPPSVTTPDGLVLAIGGWILNSGTVSTGVSITAPSGYTKLFESSDGSSIELAVATKYISGAEDPAAFGDNTATVAETCAGTIGLGMSVASTTTKNMLLMGVG